MAWRSTIMALSLAGAWLGACSLTTDLPETSTSGPGAGGGGGSTTVVGCASVEDCPTPTNPCLFSTCIAGECGEVNIPAGLELMDSEQIPGDCLALVCDGAGAPDEKVDDVDVPVDTACQSFACIEGSLLPTSFSLGTTCADEANETVCNDAGECVQCNVASDCNYLPLNSECGERECSGGGCTMNALPLSTQTNLQPSGACLIDVCDGMGGFTTIIDDLELPDDSNPCTADTCLNGTPVFTPVPNAPCAAGLCNTNGQCVGCIQDADCGNNTDCLTWTCDTNSICIANYDPPNTPAGAQVGNDCIDTVCDGLGNEIAVPDNGEIPPPDGNTCTLDTCVNGNAQYDPSPLDTVCQGTMYCDGAGSCVACNNPGQCPQPLSECEEALCASKACDIGSVALGTPTSVQIPGDCQTQICDGMGGITGQAQNNDQPNDNNECTGDTCVSGVPTYPPAGAGVPCAMGTNVCDGAGDCVDCLSDSDCTSAQYCDGATNTCMADRATGLTCARAAQCQSGRCIDGYCCSTTCTGNCSSCDGSKTGGNNGTCGLITAGTDPYGECPGSQVCYSGACCDNVSMPIETEMGYGVNQQIPLCPKMGN